MNSRQGDPNSFVATNKVKATFEGCISVTEATWNPHRINFPEMFNTTTTCIYPFSRRVYRQQVDLDPHYLYYHSWRLGMVLCIKRDNQKKIPFCKERKSIMKKGRAFFDWLFFLHMHTQGANWMVGRKPGETERGIESLDLEARSLSHKFPFKYIKATRQVFFVSSSLCIIVYPQ